jgi:Rrf2 family protein
MNLARSSGYALHALAHMARQAPDRFVPSHVTAGAAGIPERYLLKMLHALASAGLLHSIQGPRGGYRLTRPAEDITLLEVVEAVDGPVTSSVPDDFAPAKDRLDKRLAEVFQESAGVVRERLGKVRLADLLKG